MEPDYVSKFRLLPISRWGLAVIDQRNCRDGERRNSKPSLEQSCFHCVIRIMASFAQFMVTFSKLLSHFE